MRRNTVILIFTLASLLFLAAWPGPGSAARAKSHSRASSRARPHPSLEVALNPLLVRGATVFGRASIKNPQGQLLGLEIYGAGLAARRKFEVAAGGQDIEFPVQGGNPGSLFLELKDSRNRIVDRQEIGLKDAASGTVAVSDLVISDGKPVKIRAGHTAAIYARPARLLADLAANLAASTRFGFGHAEAVGAAAAMDAMLLRAAQEGVISGAGFREALASDLNRAVRDLQDNFYSPEAKLFRPYPGQPEQALWSARVCLRLKTVAANLEGSPELQAEFASALGQARAMVAAVTDELQKGNTTTAELGSQAANRLRAEAMLKESHDQTLPDAAEVQWFVGRALPALDLPAANTWREVEARLAALAGAHPPLQAFAGAGAQQCLLAYAEALYLRHDSHFVPLFNQIAKGAVAGSERPVLLPGVCAAPGPLLKFIGLLITLAGHPGPASVPVTLKTNTGACDQITLGPKPMLISNPKQDLTLKAPPYVMLRQDGEQSVSLYDYLDPGRNLCTIEPLPETMSLGAETGLTVNLDPSLDPNDYCALIAVPVVLALRQSENPPTGAVIENQQLLAVPFRGSGTIRLALAASQKGKSPGYVLVRHLGDPEIIAAVKIPEVTVMEKPAAQEPLPVAPGGEAPTNP